MEIASNPLKHAGALARAALRARVAKNDAWLAEIPPLVSKARWVGIPKRYRPLWLRLTRGEGTPRQAIKAQCLECCGFDRDAVRDCSARACPLWTKRPR